MFKILESILIAGSIKCQGTFCISDVEFDLNESFVRITLDRIDRSGKCPKCKSFHSILPTNKNYSLSSIRHLDLFQFKTFLVIQQYEVYCPLCKHTWILDIPFRTTQGRHTDYFASLGYELCKIAAVRNIARFLRVSEDRLRTIEKHFIPVLADQREIESVRVLQTDEKAVIHGKSAEAYVHIISDLEHQEVLGVGDGRSEENVTKTLENIESKWHIKDTLEFVLVDMWKPFRLAYLKFKKNVRFVFERFHIKAKLNEALNDVRKSEYKKASKKNHVIIKGNKFVLLSNWERLKGTAKTALKQMLRANKVLDLCYLLKEDFMQIYNYVSAAWARKFFEQWKGMLKRRRIKPMNKFVKLIEKHWYGIENAIALKKEIPGIKYGCAEGINTVVEALLRRGYGYRNKEYLKMKIIQMGSKSLRVFSPWVIHSLPEEGA